MASAKDVANYFLYLDSRCGGDGISNLKLQKLAYYAQGFHCAIHNKPLFAEPIEAWTHGPVVPALYHEYKGNSSNLIPVPTDFDPACLAEKEKELADEIFQVFGQYSAWKLRDMTHEEAPWLNHEKNADAISIPELTEYFKSRIN